MSENKIFKNLLTGTLVSSIFWTPSLTAEAKPKKAINNQKIERLSTRVKEKLDKLDRNYCVNHPIKCTKDKLKKFRNKHNF